MSRDWWGSKHTRHHANPNRVSKDPDIEVDTIRFLEVDAEKVSGPMSLITRRQGWLFFPLLTLEGLNLHFLAFRHLLNFRHPVKDRWLELGLLALRFALVLTPVFLFLPLGMAFAFIGVQMAVFGVYMGAAFAPNHKGMPIIDADAKLDFFTKQVRTSRNVSGGWWATWLMGGLNYQIEHHLFPSMPRPHLAQAREIVKELLRDARRALHRDDAAQVVRHRDPLPQRRRALGRRPVRMRTRPEVPHQGNLTPRADSARTPDADRPVLVSTKRSASSCLSRRAADAASAPSTASE